MPDNVCPASRPARPHLRAHPVVFLPHTLRAAIWRDDWKASPSRSGWDAFPVMPCRGLEFLTRREKLHSCCLKLHQRTIPLLGESPHARPRRPDCKHAIAQKTWTPSARLVPGLAPSSVHSEIPLVCQHENTATCGKPLIHPRHSPPCISDKALVFRRAFSAFRA